MSQVKLKVVCGECENKFTIQYNDELAESFPVFCPFCAEYISEDDSDDQDEMGGIDEEEED